MIRLPPTIYVATEPVNLHPSFDRLAGIVRNELGGEPRGEAAYLFHNRRRTDVKTHWRFVSGYFLLYKRLDRGVYRIPLAIPACARQVAVRCRELELLLDGIDRRALRAARQSVATRSRIASKRLSECVFRADPINRSEVKSGNIGNRPSARHG